MFIWSILSHTLTKEVSQVSSSCGLKEFLLAIVISCLPIWNHLEEKKSCFVAMSVVEYSSTFTTFVPCDTMSLFTNRLQERVCVVCHLSCQSECFFCESRWLFFVDKTYQILAWKTNWIMTVIFYHRKKISRYVPQCPVGLTSSFTFTVITPPAPNIPINSVFI